MKIKGIIFDLDGTLIDSLGDVANFANTVLRSFGFKERNKEEYRYLAGQGVYNLMAASSGSQDETCIKKMSNEFAKLYEESGNNPRVYLGIDEILAQLELKNIKKSVLSNKPEQLTKICVNQCFSGFAFDAVFGQRDGVPVKPNPILAHEIASIFGLLPSEIAIIGDSKNDILTAKNGGFYAVGVTWGFRDRAEFEENGADMIVDEPSEILELLTIT